MATERPPVVEESIRFPAEDGYILGGTFHSKYTEEQPRHAVVFNCGGGLAARRYRHFARFLAAWGIPVLTYDYRGIGDSRPKSLRGFDATIEDWSEYDCGGAIRWVRTRMGDIDLIGMGHSVGTIFFGGPANGNEVSRYLMVGPHTGYFGDYKTKYRVPMAILWHGILPALTAAFGYFPGRLLNLGDDIPKGVANQWARRRSANFLPKGTPEKMDRFRRLERRCENLAGNALILTFTDDGFATEAGARRICAYFPNLSFENWLIDPREFGIPQIGHFGFFRRNESSQLWRTVLARLLLLEPGGLSKCSVPPSGTKETDSLRQPVPPLS